MLAEQTAAGYALEPAWFAPHFEFRFPKYGDFASMRRASWSCARRSSRGTCMGEEGAAGGAVRYVDSSVERVQVKVTGLAPDRYAIACNGRRVPLQPTGTRRRIRRRGALSCVAAGLGPASDASASIRP